MSGDYSVLATIHNELGLGNFASQAIPALVDFAQRNGWMGRKVLDLGCGSGEGTSWLAKHGYIVTGIDRSSAMLGLARVHSGTGVTWQQQDIQQLQGLMDFDLAFAIDVLHEFHSLRTLEAIFQQVASVLKSDRLFIFDIYTIEGLFARHQQDVVVEHETDDLMVIATNQFDYERQIQKRRYTIFREEQGIWHRQDAERELRAYPIQGIIGLLGRNGFKVNHTLNDSLGVYSSDDSTNRVFIVAQKS